MLCDFRKTFKPTPQEQLEQYKYLLKIHQEQIGHCCTCARYKPTCMPGFVTDYGECLANEPTFADRVCRRSSEKIDPCEHYEEETGYIEMLSEYIQHLEEDAEKLESIADKYTELGEQYLVPEGTMKGE